MSRRRIFGGLLLVASVFAFVITWQNIAWMVSGGFRDYVQLGALVVSLGAGSWGMMTMCRGAPRT